MLWLLLFPVLLGLFIWKLVTEEENPVDKLPGPKKLPIVGSPFIFLNKESHEMFELLRRLNKEYGDRFLLKIFNRRLITISNPVDAEVILTHPRNISKSTTYRFVEPWLGNGLLLSTGSKWHQRRKLLNPTFNLTIMKSFSTIIEENSKDLVQKLKKTNGGPVDLLPIISDVTLTNLCDTAMGIHLNSVTSEYKEAIKQIAHDITTRLKTVWLHFDCIFKRSQLGKELEKKIHKIHDFCDKIIMERKKQIKDVPTEDTEEFGIKKRMAMLDLLLEDEKKGEIDLEGIREEVITFMVAGQDTTAITLTFMLLMIAEHEEVQERIYEECQRIFGDSDRIANMTDLSEMKYLEAVIKESLRLYPAGPAIARSITEDFYLGDLKVKKGTDVVIQIYDLHRRPDLYPDPERFNPDRFLNPEPRHAFAYVPFSAGPRNCIGQRFAMLEMKSAVSQLVRAFKLTPVNKGFRPRLQSEISLKPVDPILLNFLPRNA